MNRFYLFALIVCLHLSFASIAGTLTGKVTDTKGEALPFATVFIQNTPNGTTANADGEYQLSLPAGEYKVTCQYMGFAAVTFTVNFTGNETVKHNFSLQDQSLQMKDVVVKANAEDPAYNIIRKTIKRRKFHLDQVRSFQTSVYVKGVFRLRGLPDEFMGEKVDKSEMGSDTSGKGVMYLCEEDVDYYSKGDKDRTVVKAVHESGDPNGLGIARIPPVVTFYENNVNIISGMNPRGFISPVSDNAIYYYKFKYEGEYQENGYTIDKIRVIPRRKYEPLFTGVIYIAEEDWAIQSLDLMVTQTSNLEFLDTLNVEQTHRLLKKDTWVVQSQVLYPTIKMLGFDITGYFVGVYSKQKVNEPMPDTIFRKRIESSYEANANKKDTSYWVSRPVPLQEDEQKDFRVKDSIYKVHSDPKYIDSMRRKGNKFAPVSGLLNGYTYSGKKYSNVYTTNGLLTNLVNYNSVEGLNVAPKLTWMHRLDTGETLITKAAVRYGFSNQHLNGIASVFYTHGNRKWIGRSWSLGVEGGKYVFQLNPNSTLVPIENTFTTLVQGYNFMKIYERWNGAIYFKRNYGNGFSFDVKLDYERRSPLENTTSYSFANKPEITPNTPAPLAGAMPWAQNDAAIVRIGFSYRPGYKYIQYPDYKMPMPGNYPTFRLVYEKGIPNILNSVSDFDKWRFSVEDELGLKLFGQLNYKLAAGGFLNSKYVSLPDMMHLGDNQLILAAPYTNSFQLAKYYRYSNTEQIYGEAHLDYHLKGLLTNKIPLLRQAKWYLVTGGNAFFANTNNYYAEAFAGLENLGFRAYRILRVDFVYSWDSYNQNTYGIRVGIDPTSIFKISFGDRNETW